VAAAFWLPGEPNRKGQNQERRAALMCSRGHVVTYRATDEPPEDSLGYCASCGAPVLGRCPSCRIRIRGLDFVPGHMNITYELPKFCDSCGEPFPWAGRQERFYQLQNILDQQDIDPTDRLLVQEDLRRLRESADMELAQEVEIWKKIRARAPGMLADSALKIASSVMTAAIKAKLGLN
jgi:hypothetical protein